MALFDKFKKKKQDEFIKIDVKPLIDWNEPGTNNGKFIEDDGLQSILFEKQQITSD